MVTQALVFLTGFVVFYAAHLATDYPLQTDRQAARKAGWTESDTDPHPGRHHHGWGANQAHAGTHTTLSLTALLLIPNLALGLPLSALGTVAALAWIHVSHAAIDRRVGVAWWMRHTGQTAFQAHGGAAHVDQAAHIVLGLLPAALLLAKLG
ncbi:DUF3307 domain-containing protein [Streptomyces sp. BPTC-684]|uniref:DUF3307 domain-containing protein n=1 Tax=Streptomyces sp. BPTC-684 TaxID=3043734 RepID=UPI0024B189F6|nr:DUF3307 domain-containing protein [Streptomyces sp. BPTC-684]WHM41100.1 DUF3307 domain-containing protein [Streptomyces sp. BPTC-684]